jgi:hypothetical protein
MFPVAVRGRVMALSLIASNLAQLVTNLCFLPLTAAVGPAATFGLFLAANILAGLFIQVALTETKNDSPAQILEALQQRSVQYSPSRCICPARRSSDTLLKASGESDAKSAHGLMEQS